MHKKAIIMLLWVLVCTGCANNGDKSPADGGDSGPMAGDRDEETDTGSGSNGDTDTDVDTDVDTDGDIDADADSDTQTETATGTETSGDAPSDVGTDSGNSTEGTWDSETESGTDGDADTDTDGDMDIDADTDLDSDIDTDINSDIDTDGDTDVDTDADTDTDADAGVDADVGEDSGTDTSTATDSATDTISDTHTDTGETDGDSDTTEDTVTVTDTNTDTGTDTFTDTGTATNEDTGTDSETNYMYICSYSGEERTCECADGVDNDTNGFVDDNDIHCFGPFDDDETSFATGVPGDNNGSKGYKECPFDGNSGVGNDDVCCNPEDASTNVTPNGCDHQGCCEVDLNQNLTGEFVYVGGTCDYAPVCGTSGTLGCECQDDGNCDGEQNCVHDDNTGTGFCSTCEPCTPSAECLNPCDCGEICFAGFTRPISDCTDTGSGSCGEGYTPCPNGNIDCSLEMRETCIQGCCYMQCRTGVTPCTTTADCDDSYTCITGCCISF